ncbi:MAG TPA: hypothetical protein VNT76_18160 [Candidatus Binatus sp.]|nr:hypothetical protein [Candidatus Binatus sp.]
MKFKFYLGLLTGAAFFFGSQVLAHACSVCITGANDPTADAFNASVLFLMATPYAVVGSIGGGLFYAYRRKIAKPAPEEGEQSVGQLDLNQEEVGR